VCAHLRRSFTEHPDGTRSFAHSIVKAGDGIIDTLGTDRGEGSNDSIKLLREEGDTVKVDRLLPPKNDGPARDASGRFISKRK